jgi:CARDB
MRPMSAVGLVVVALLAASPGAEAKQGKGRLPDLTVAKVSKPPASALRGTSLSIIVKVRNKGTARASKSRLGLYLAKGKKHQRKDLRLKRVKLKTLRGGKKRKAKLQALIPKSTSPGSYRLIACADDAKKLRESKERDNCRATRAFSVTLLPTAPAFAMDDGVDWGFVDDTNSVKLNAGDQVTVTLTTANGIAGQAGYSRSNVAPEPLIGGASSTLDYSAESNSEDDGAVSVALPFSFPFGGINYPSVSVSTNGWVSFGAPAWDYWNDSQNSDYRGFAAIVGEFERGIMPYWADLSTLDDGAGIGTVKEVVAAGNSAVAFQWDVGQYQNEGSPRRVFQLVLFPDGRFRFDYPGSNAPGGNPAFVGYSRAIGPASFDAVAANTGAVPANSLLFTPNPASAETALPAGQATLTLPPGAGFISGAGCSLTVAPAPLSGGLATCPTPELAGGQQAAQTVTFAMPPDAPGEGLPADFRFSGTLTAGGFTLTDGNEINALGANFHPADISVNADYVLPVPPKVGVAATFAAVVKGANGDLDEPTVTFSLPTNATFNSIEISGEPIPCDAPSGGQVTCKLPSGTHDTEPVVTVTPSASAAGKTMTLEATARALNSGTASDGATSPSVIP